MPSIVLYRLLTVEPSHPDTWKLPLWERMKADRPRSRRPNSHNRQVLCGIAGEWRRVRHLSDHHANCANFQSAGACVDLQLSCPRASSLHARKPLGDGMKEPGTVGQHGVDGHWDRSCSSDQPKVLPPEPPIPSRGRMASEPHMRSLPKCSWICLP